MSCRSVVLVLLACTGCVVHQPYRLVEQGGRKAGETEFTALALAGRPRVELEQRTKLLEKDTNSCGKPGDSWCTAIPKRVAVNPFVAVTVNGHEVLVAWGGNVRDTILEAGERQANTVLPRLVVSRLYQGRATPVRFAPASPVILNLILTGGETIAWQ